MQFVTKSPKVGSLIISPSLWMIITCRGTFTTELIFLYELKQTIVLGSVADPDPGSDAFKDPIWKKIGSGLLD